MVIKLKNVKQEETTRINVDKKRTDCTNTVGSNEQYSIVKNDNSPLILFHTNHFQNNKKNYDEFIIHLPRLYLIKNNWIFFLLTFIMFQFQSCLSLTNFNNIVTIVNGNHCYSFSF